MLDDDLFQIEGGFNEEAMREAWLSEEGLADFPDNDPVNVDAHMDRLLEKAQQIKQQMERNKGYAARRIKMIQDHVEGENAVLERQLNWIERSARVLVSVMKFPGKAKTRRLAFGRIGYRAPVGHVEIDDPKKAVEWSKANNVDIKVEPSKSALGKFAKANGDKLPETSGARFVKPTDDDFFFTPTKSGDDEHSSE